MNQQTKTWADVMKEPKEVPSPSTSKNIEVVELSSDSEPDRKSAKGRKLVKEDSDIDVVGLVNNETLISNTAKVLITCDTKYSSSDSDGEVIAISEGDIDCENDNVIEIFMPNNVEVISISDDEDKSSIEDVSRSSCVNSLDFSSAWRKVDRISNSSMTTIGIEGSSTINQSDGKEFDLNIISHTSRPDDDLTRNDINENLILNTQDNALDLDDNTEDPNLSTNDKSSSKESKASTSVIIGPNNNRTTSLNEANECRASYPLHHTQICKENTYQSENKKISLLRPSISKDQVTPRQSIRSIVVTDSDNSDDNMEDIYLLNQNTTMNDISSISSLESTTSVVSQAKNKNITLNDVFESAISQDNPLPTHTIQSEIRKLSPLPSTSKAQITPRKRTQAMTDSDNDSSLNLNKTTNDKIPSQESISSDIIIPSKRKRTTSYTIDSEFSQDNLPPRPTQTIKANASQQEINELSPQPSTSKSCKSTPRRRIRAFIPSDSDTNSSDGSIQTFKSKRKSRPRPTPKNTGKRNRNRTYTKTTPRRSSRLQGGNKDHDTTEASDSNESLFSPIDPPNKKKTPTLRRSGRTQNKTIQKNKAFDKLLKARELKASKPKRDSPEREKLHTSVSGDDKDSDSSSDSEWSPVPIVDGSDDSPVGTDFEDDGSTPSSSSVSSGKIGTDEEPDLGSGSEGDKALSHCTDTDDKTEEDDKDEPSVSSSSDEMPDDGQNDPRCILCKNLVSGDFEGRAYAGNPKAWCKCGECTMFSPKVGDYDLVCCREISSVVGFMNDELDDPKTCITKHPRFKLDVLEYEAYARAVSKHTGPKRFQGTYQGNFYENYQCGKPNERLANIAKDSFKYADQYQKMGKCCSSYLHWIFDKLYKHQMVIPACVLKNIRENFNIDIYHFSPFSTNYKCPNGRHCRLASGD